MKPLAARAYCWSVLLLLAAAALACYAMSQQPAGSPAHYIIEACRASSTVPFAAPRSHDPNNRDGFNVFFHGEAGFPLADVGSYHPDHWGIYDVPGNAWEWCRDWFGWDYYAHSPTDDPQGADHGVFRMTRYADWRFTGHDCKHTKVQCEPWVRNGFVGFRVVCDR